MSYFPPDHERPHDPLDGRDATILKHHKTLKPIRVIEDTDHIDSDRVPYDDLQASPNPCTGSFAYTYDQGTLAVCDRVGYLPRVRALITIRNDIDSTGTRRIMVALRLPNQQEDE